MTRPRCLVIGRGLIGSRFELAGWDMLRVGHREAFSEIETAEPDLVVNAALDPNSLRERQPDELLLDVAYARRLRPAARYLMLSSRKIYGDQQQWGAIEGYEGEPSSAYGYNKLRSEKLVLAMLGEDRTLIARLPNVYSLELEGRASFFQLMLTSLLARDEVVFNFGADTRRDFLLLDDCLSLLRTLVGADAAGVFNVGYGKPVSCGEIASALISGYGSGSLRCTTGERIDEFYLRVEKLAAIPSATSPSSNVRGAFELGKALRAYRDGR